ncbi:CLUMA_CG006454, isoform A [Clunio marinus]|uniref:CLUMA_CG006454, isoform A n=1 Tax=Clunio marinus TaxID=568069 RepID=A0A1J1HYR1_9DIPT|nr:CLUMA_CG006454, isoform A [Clunio marinus]
MLMLAFEHSTDDSTFCLFIKSMITWKVSSIKHETCEIKSKGIETISSSLLANVLLANKL